MASTPVRILRAAGAALLAAAGLALSGCGKPIVVEAVALPGRDPLPEVRIYRHVFGFFALFPGKKFVHTDAQGDAEVMVGSANTNLTMVRSGYEPVLFGVFETANPSIAADKGGYDHVILYKEIQSKPKNRYEVDFTPVRRVPLELTVTDAATKRPVAGADVYGATFLYLPQPGVEPDWGFPPLQHLTTDGDGKATVDQVSGFRNRVTVRLKGYQDGLIAFDGRTIEGARAMPVELRPLRVKTIEFLVVDAKTKRPVPGAEVRLGESRDGLPANPNGWTRAVDAAGSTGPMPFPDLEPCVISVKAQGYEEWRGAPVWRALVDGQVKRLEMRRK